MNWNQLMDWEQPDELVSLKLLYVSNSSWKGKCYSNRQNMAELYAAEMTNVIVEVDYFYSLKAFSWNHFEKNTRNKCTVKKR